MTGENVLRVDVPARSVHAGGCFGLSDPSVRSEAVQRGAGGLASDAAGQGEASDVGFHGGADGGEGEEVQRV